MRTCLDVLVVDDDQYMRDLLCDLLSEAGYFVQAVGSARDAVLRLRDTPPRLLITDLQMPEVSGDQLAVQVRTMGLEALPIIMMSADMRVLDMAVAVEVAVLPKPFMLNEVLQIVGQYLT